MTPHCRLRTFATLFFAALWLAAPRFADAQDSPAPEKPEPRTLWSIAKEGTLSFSARYRLEAFERDGAPYTATAFAPTLRLALGYATAEFHGFSLFAQGEAVIVTGPADYSDPTLPSQNRPNLPAILDPKSMELNQGYLKWTHKIEGKKLAFTVGRQEMALNDGRFLRYSDWRQVHGSFDAARADVELPANFSFAYAFINQFHRVVGYDATDGSPHMHSHLGNLLWTRPGRVRASAYALLLDYRDPVQFTLSTKTFGIRVNGPYEFGPDWKLVYTAEFAKQMNYATNPNRVDANYYLGEFGPGWRDFSFKAGYALLAGRTLTDKLSTPLSPPYNGWSDLFFLNPSGGGGNGLEARYLYGSGPVKHLDGTVATVIFYDYHSDNLHIHYGRELDMSMAYKMKRITSRWEIGWRFARYWSDQLFTPAIRTSIYSSFTL